MGGERQHSVLLAFVFLLGFLVVLLLFFFKGGFVTSPSLFLFLLSMESFASARPCDWKKSQFTTAEQGGCFFFLFLFQSS